MEQEDNRSNDAGCNDCGEEYSNECGQHPGQCCECADEDGGHEDIEDEAEDDAEDDD